MRDPKTGNVPNESKLQRALMPNSRMFLLFLIVFAVLTFFFSDRLWLSIGEGVIILLLIIYSVIMRARKRRTLERYIESVTYDTESARNNTLQNFPLPMAVFRPADSQVIWANQNFFDLCGRHKPSVDMRITDVIPEFSGRWLLEGNTQCPELLEYQGRKYQIHGNLVRTNPDDAASYMGITYWVDVTDYEKIRLEYYASRPIIAVIVIDNYDELIRGLTDRKRNELRDAVEDKLLQWCEGKGGFFRRYDRDRYLYVFEERHLDELRENKFASLLDIVHSVTSPSGIRATVSVGVGRDGESLDENYNFAILGTEMALSRGGDQAVVKNRVTFEFFGGRGGEVERRTKVKSRVMANALSQLIQDSSKVYVMGHRFSDLDTLGAAAGVCCIARKFGTPCRIVMDANKTAAGQLRDRMLSAPEYSKAFLSPQEAFLHADSRTLLANGAVSGKTTVAFDGGTVKPGALVGRQVLIGNACVTVKENTASSMTVDAPVTVEDNAILYPGEAGAQGRDVYATLVLGADGYGTTEITGGGLEHIVKQLGSAGTGDPLNQRASVGWKATKVAVRLDDSAIRRIETCSTYTE